MATGVLGLAPKKDEVATNTTNAQKAAISERVKVKIAQEVGQSNVEIIERVSP